MSTQHYRILLRSDALFTASSGTVGRPESVDALPGAALLGVAAARVYGKLPSSFETFQLGGARFGEGRPVHPVHGLAVPIPRSWHARKGEEGACMLDLSAGKRPQGQLRQAREAWVVRGADGAWLRWSLGRRSSLRTAVQEDGRAREGFLFGFEAVPAGTTYRAAVTGPAEVHSALARGTIRVGRSRSAEFGDAWIEAWATPPTDALAPRLANPRRVRFLCASDLALVDGDTGAPRLVPSAEDFGLSAGWRLDTSRSFLRFRRYSPFHGHRRRPDMERQVIEAGSVLTFEHAGGEPLDLEGLRSRVAAGVGEHRGAGLGEVLVEPAVLDLPVDGITLGEADEGVRPPVTAPPPVDPLAAWLEDRHGDRIRLDSAWEAAESFIVAKRLAEWPVSRSQWGRVRALAGQHRRRGGLSSGVDVVQAFETYTGKGVAADAWGRRAGTVTAWLKERGSDAALCLEILGRRVPRHLADVDSLATKEDADRG